MLSLFTHFSGMATTRDDDHAGVAALNDLFRCQAALNTALGRWQAQWSRPIPIQPVTLQEVGLAVSFSRSGEGLYSATLLHEQGASLESGCCSSALETYWLVLGMVRPECLWIR
ncbi:hypothetical protein [Cyanobium sp. ATX 6A2]|uniref:hypothetical protein n=1 Tax=Cyanobium sp. ATX 6A2 TaxID=2823700 RepID=UPI0020CD330B|nr:hypothetical protein [Cyanobium sp. ATX 6A2]